MDRTPYVQIRVTQRYGVAPERVFDAWLDPAMASTWLFATASRPIARAEIDARVGGAFRFVDGNGHERVQYTGVYLEIVAPRRLAFMLSVEHDRKARTRVITEIVPRDGGCTSTLTHENLPRDHAARFEARWTGMLYGLGVKLELAARAPGVIGTRRGRRAPSTSPRRPGSLSAPSCREAGGRGLVHDQEPGSRSA